MPLILEKEPGVEFKEIANIFITSFARPFFLESPEQPTFETIDKTIDKDLSAIEKALIRMIEVNSSVTQKEIADQLNLSEVGIRYTQPDSGFLRGQGPSAISWPWLRDQTRLGAVASNQLCR